MTGHDIGTKYGAVTVGAIRRGTARSVAHTHTHTHLFTTRYKHTHTTQELGTWAPGHRTCTAVAPWTRAWVVVSEGTGTRAAPCPNTLRGPPAVPPPCHLTSLHPTPPLHLHPTRIFPPSLFLASLPTLVHWHGAQSSRPNSIRLGAP